MHQCIRCGLMYDCGQPRCGRPFFSGVCPESEAFAHKSEATFAMS